MQKQIKADRVAGVNYALQLLQEFVHDTERSVVFNHFNVFVLIGLNRYI